MKLILLSTLFLTVHLARTQNVYRYIAETTSLDSLVLIEGNHRRVIPSSLSDNTQFRFEVSNSAAASLQLFCSSCDSYLSLKLWGRQEDSFTRWITMQNRESIKIVEIFSRYPEESQLTKFYKSISQILNRFWWSANNGGRTARARGPILKSDDPEPSEAKLEFSRTDYTYFLMPEAFELSMRIAAKYPINSLYLHDHSDKLLLLAGEPEFPFDEQDAASVPTCLIEKVIRRTNSIVEEPSKYSLQWSQLNTCLAAPLERGKWYQLEIQLKGDDSEWKTYLFSFQFFPLKNIQETLDWMDGKRD